MPEQLSEFIFKFFLFYIPLLFSLCVHEFAHAWTAQKKGDQTAFYEGRLTLNPLAHIDYLGTVILPFIFLWTSAPIFFGWAKPVPVDSRAFQKPKEDMFWVALAGPLSNIFLALLSSAVLALAYILTHLQILPGSKAFMSMLEMMIYVNMFLAFFNLIPLHPLDGGKVIARFLPPSWNIFLEDNQKYCYILLIVLILLGGFHFLAVPILSLSQSLISLAQSLSQLFMIF